VAKLLLEKGAELDLKGSQSQTQLSLTEWSGNETVVKLPLKKGTELLSEDKGSERCYVERRR
jgi:ankyrin repeat protein